MLSDIPSFETLAEKIRGGKTVIVGLFDGTHWYLNRVSSSQKRFFGRWTNCTKSSSQPIYYDEIAEVVDEDL